MAHTPTHPTRHEMEQAVAARSDTALLNDLDELYDEWVAETNPERAAHLSLANYLAVTEAEHRGLLQPAERSSS